MNIDIDDKNLAQALDCCWDESKKVNMPSDVLIRFISKLYKNSETTGEIIGNLFKEKFIQIQNDSEYLEKIKTGKRCLCSVSVSVGMKLKKLGLMKVPSLLP